MISFAGNCLLIVAMISCGVVVVIGCWRHCEEWLARRGNLRRQEILTSTKDCLRLTTLFFLTNIAIILSFLLLVIAFVSSDFSLKNVFLNSSTIKPLIYKIAGSWASHEGSILLYLTMLSTISSIYLKTSNYRYDTKNLQITILAFVQMLFLCFVYFTSNPFDSFRFIPNQGLGLNPVLQDKALSIHPPLLYMGYVCYVTTYVNAILLLLKPEDRQNILQNNLRFSSLALMALTAGIGLGSWWAYRELGWGGYWFFDPVENISLMPWLVGIALHHFLLISIKETHPESIAHHPEQSEESSSKTLGSGLTLNWTIFTSLLAFLLTTYGIFFVRSGIISSVHSFAFSAQRGQYLFAICMVLTLVAVIAWVRGKTRHPEALAEGSHEASLNSHGILKQVQNDGALGNGAKTKLILLANFLWLLAFGTLFIALIYPVYYSFFYDIDIAIDPEYFQKIFIPIFIPITLLAAIAPNISKVNFRIMACILTSAISVIITHYYSKNVGVISGGVIFASVFLMTQMIDYVVLKTNYFQNSITSSKLSLFMGHFSLGMIAFTITMNVLFSEQIEFIGKIGDSVSNKSFSVKLNDIKFGDGLVYYRQIAEFAVADNKGNIVTLKPENRLYKIEKTLSQESDIYSYLTHDMFAVLSKIDGDTIHAIIYYRPMIYFIWFSLFLMSSTFGVYLWGRRPL